VAGSGIPVFAVSAATRQGFDALMDETSKLLRTLPPPIPFEEEEIPFEVGEKEGFTISKTDGIYDVTGPAMVRLLDSVNFGEEESLNWFHRTLRRMGVIDALREAGAKEGDTVRIEDMEFDFVE
jgi:GTP-binding protein